MTNHAKFKLAVLPSKFTLYQLDPGCGIPAAIVSDAWFAINKSSEELSVLTTVNLTKYRTRQPGWRVLQMIGPIATSETGVMDRLTHPLARAKISVFAIASYSTDNVAVPADQLNAALEVLGNDFEIVLATH